MKAKRRRHDSAFKARVALEAMKEEKTIHQIAKENDVHPTQVTEWKKMLAENIAGVFEGANALGKRILKRNGRDSIPRLVS
jgi:transposase-like protein